MGKKKTKAASPIAPSADGTVRAFLIGASPDAQVAHTQEVLGRLRADPTRDLFVGVDGGVQHWLDAGFKPHLAVGDWDSFTGAAARKVLTSIHHLTLPVDKDRSDLYYAACAVFNAGATQLLCLGVTGGRPDHQQATLFELAALTGAEIKTSAEKKTPHFQLIAAYGPEAEYRFVSKQTGPWKDSFMSSRTVSVFAMSNSAQGVKLKGFKYQMVDEELAPSSRGLSNRTWSASSEVSTQAGCLLVLIPTERAGFSLPGPKTRIESA